MTTTTDNGTVVTTGSAPSSWRVHPIGSTRQTDLPSPSRKLSSLLPPLIDHDEEEEDPDRHLRPEVVREHSPDARGRPPPRPLPFPVMGYKPSSKGVPVTAEVESHLDKRPDVVRSHSSSYLAAWRRQMPPQPEEEEQHGNRQRLLTRMSSLKVSYNYLQAAGH